MRVLVTVGSERGGTEGLGEMVAEDLRAEGFQGFPASAMAKKRAGDWRDPVQVEKWAHDVAAELRAAQAGTVAAAG